MFKELEGYHSLKIIQTGSHNWSLVCVLGSILLRWSRKEHYSKINREYPQWVCFGTRNEKYEITCQLWKTERNITTAYVTRREFRVLFTSRLVATNQLIFLHKSKCDKRKNWTGEFVLFSNRVVMVFQRRKKINLDITTYLLFRGF